MSLSRQRRFPRARRSVPAARAFALETLMEWGYRDRQDDVRLCVSELATNALLHGVPPGREFSLVLTGDGPLVRVEVRDSGGGGPRVRDVEADDCGGRGLHLVMALADDFGVTPHHPGKTVWAVLKMDPAKVEAAVEAAEYM
ncbi:ATP-binding protein [Streptomyces sp. NPDC018972]|uniref:ATP-binding protein n=1 Tax=Streptomyces sp. NPDC018972 TaxID=3365060 RepID=UPI0037B5A5FE